MLSRCSNHILERPSTRSEIPFDDSLGIIDEYDARLPRVLMAVE